MRPIFLLPLLALTGAVATAQPVVSAVANAASNRLSGLPSSQLAQGAIGVAYGRNLGPANIVIASTLPWPTTLSGTSAQFVAGGQTIDLPLYYTSATQIAFLFPSNAPTGGGMIRVTYNGQTSANFAIGTVQSNLGIFTVNSQGSGPAIVTYPDYSLVTPAKAANPGQTLILWGTGLGPVAGNETSTPLPGDMTNVPLRLWIGGVAANIVYRGRSGCCIAEDQVVFVAPEGVSGCNVPIVAQINNAVSNYATMAIAPTGSTCSPYNPNAPAGGLAQLAAVNSPSIGFIDFTRQAENQPENQADRGEAGFLKINGSGKLLAEALDQPPLGTCTVTPFYNAPGPPNDDPFATLPLSVLDAGASLAVSNSGRNRTLSRTPDGTYGSRFGDGSPGNYLDPGVYTVSGSGGRDVGGFTTSITVPPPLVWTNPPAGNTPVARASGLTVNWSGGDPYGVVFIGGQGFILTAPGSNTVFAGVQFQCSARASAGTFTIPPAVLLTLPPQPANPQGARPVGGFMYLWADTPPVTFTASGIDVGTAFYEYSGAGVPVAFQ